MLALLIAANLGVSNFTATGPRACQRKVLEGVLLLHSFVYEDARDAFVEAQKALPCPIAFWGEAMTYDHPIWGEQDTSAGKAALAKISPGAKLSPMERGLVEAAHALYEQNAEGWMNRLAALHRDLPKDDEVSLFYALSLYANSSGGRNAARAKEAADLAEDVFHRHPDHPGAAHYLIHACDAPDVARRALDAARRYAQIAPAAGHALHMPSHIFVQLGMWKEAEAGNVAAVKAGEDRVALRKLPIARADWHAYSWLASARLELGKADEVLPMIERVRQLAAQEKDPELRSVQAELALKWLTATQEWSRADELLAMATMPAEDEPGFVDPERAYEGCHHTPYELQGRLDATLARLDAAAATGDEALAATLAVEFNALRARQAARAGYFEHWVQVGKMIAAAKVAQARSVRDSGSIVEAIAATRTLAETEARFSVRGPVASRPAVEELGELFLRSHRFAEAQDAFRASLAKRPNRRQALEGLAEAAQAVGDQRTAADAHAKLTAQVQ